VAAALGVFVPARIAVSIGQYLLALGSGNEQRLPLSELIGRFIIGLAAPPETWHAEWRRLSWHHDVAAIYGKSLRPVLDQDPLVEYRAAILRGTGSLIDRCLIADQTHYLPSDMLFKVDAMSMAHGLEIRVPFLDRRIMDFAARLNAALLCPLSGPTKLILRRSLQRLGGPSTVVRASKKGFNVPIARLLRGPLASLGDELLDNEPDILQPLLDPDGVRRLWRSHRNGTCNSGYLIWALLSVLVWCKSFNVSCQP
jgi:asparagine synthase (glutamine-hydrolysing)